MAAKKRDYQSLSSELESVLAALQNPEVKVDEAVALYKQGLTLIAELEVHVTDAENTITKLKLQAAQKE